MKKLIYGFGALLLLGSSLLHAKCTESEEPVFQCNWKNTEVSICLDTKKDLWSYRNQSVGRPDFSFSNLESNNFAFSNTPFSGGGENHIRAENRGFDYYVYDRMIKTDEGPSFEAGVVVFKNKKRIASHQCLNDASIHQEAYQKMVRENFIPLDQKMR